MARNEVHAATADPIAIHEDGTVEVG